MMGSIIQISVKRKAQIGHRHPEVIALILGIERAVKRF
jgi:hypothetical protein